MKKYLAILSLLVVSVSCNKTLISDDQGISVNYSVSYPATKALGNGETVNYIWYAQYRPDGSLVKVYDPVAITPSGANCPVIMMSEQSYKIVFVAQYFQEDGENLIPTYPIDPATATMSMPLTATANSDNLDVFCIKDEVVKYDGEKSKSIELTRKTAFVNFVCFAEDWANAAALDNIPTHSAITIEGAAKSYDLLAETFSDETVTVDYAKNALTGETNNLGAVFCIVNDTKPSATLKLYKDDSLFKTIEVSDISVKMNHRTNVTGMLMTGTMNSTVSINSGTQN